MESQQHHQPSWISFRLGRLGTILVSRYATAGSEKDRLMLEFRRDSSIQHTFPLDFASVKLKKNDGFKQQTVDNHFLTRECAHAQ